MAAAKRVPNQRPLILPADGQLKVAIIGEAPGADEERIGLPFVGSSGKELDSWIRSIFIRSQCFIGNLCQERPPNNRLADWFVDPSNCTIPNERLRGWIDVLRAELEELRPNIIIALGRHPMFVLTGKDGITNYWGSLLPCTLVPGLKVMPIVHPSFVIRGLFDLRPVIRTFLKRAQRHSMFPELRLPSRKLVVDPPLETVMYELERLMSAPELAFDIETVPNASFQVHVDKNIFLPDIISCISFSDAADFSISIPFSVGTGQHRWNASIETEIWAKIMELLGQEGPLKIAHNLMFDFLQLAGRRIFVAPPYYDTMLAHNRCCLDLSKKKLKKLQLNRLAFCTALYTEEPFYKLDHKDVNKADEGWKKWRTYNHEFWLYNAKDSAVLHEIRDATWADLNSLGMADMFRTEMQVFSPLAAMGILGVHRNVSKVMELNEFVTAEVDRLQAGLDEVVGRELNTKSSPQMQQFLYGDLDMPVQINRKTQRATADEAAIAKLYQKTKNPILKDVITLTRLRGFKSSYLDSPIGPDDRSRTTYNQAKTSTARISSSDAIIGVGKNLQTIPSRPRPGEDVYNRLIKEFKKTFLADEGKLMFRRDYKQAEAMVVAWLAEDIQQIHDFTAEIDIHCRTVEILYDCDYQAAVAGYKEKDPTWIMRRNLGKPVRHGFNYKLGDQGLQRQFNMMSIDIPLKECKRLLQAMASNVPAVLRWHTEVEDTLRANRTLVNPFGLRRTFLGVLDADAIREAIAFVPQSTVGQLLNFALDKIYRNQAIMSIADFLLQIHDAVIMQAPADMVVGVAEDVGRLMEIPMQIKGRELVIDSDCEIGPSWGELADPEHLRPRDVLLEKGV